MLFSISLDWKPSSSYRSAAFSALPGAEVRGLMPWCELAGPGRRPGSWPPHRSFQVDKVHRWSTGGDGSKPMKLPYEWGNNNPLTNYFRVSRVPGFWPIARWRSKPPRRCKCDDSQGTFYLGWDRVDGCLTQGSECHSRSRGSLACCAHFEICHSFQSILMRGPIISYLVA